MNGVGDNSCDGEDSVLKLMRCVVVLVMTAMVIILVIVGARIMVVVVTPVMTSAMMMALSFHGVVDLPRQPGCSR